jgi:hypothetical protein
VIINEELITTVEYTLTNTTDAANKVLNQSTQMEMWSTAHITVNGTIRANLAI